MPKRESIDLPGAAHNAPIPNGCRVGNMLFSSAFAGRDPKTGNIPEDPDEQAAVLFSNIKAFLDHAGASAEDIGMVTVFMKDDKYRDSINKEWVKMFPDEHSRPARHAITSPVRGNLYFQVEFIAVLN